MTSPDLLDLDPAWFACAHQLTPGSEPALRQLRNDLERYRELAESGETLAILQALAICCERMLPPPAWLGAAFVTRLRAFTEERPAAPGPTSLDRLFRSARLRTDTPDRMRRDRAAQALGRRLVAAVRRVAHAHGGLDTALDEVLASGDWPVKKRRARELVNRADQYEVHLSSGRLTPLAQLYRKPCKPFRS